jgi:Leucine-rich repeat (LRR) protein
MLNKRIVIIITLFVFNALHSMDWGRLFDEVQIETQKETARKLQPDEVALSSAQGDYLPIQKNVATQSETLKNMIGEMDENKIIPIQNIDNSTLKEIISLLNNLKNSSHLKNKALLDALEKDIKITDPLALLAAANYLDIPAIFNLAARAIAREEFKKHPQNANISPELLKKIKATFGASSPDILGVIAHYYVLIGNASLLDVPRKSYGFSVQDLLDYQPHYIKKQHNPMEFRLSQGEKSIGYDLENLQLTSLDGIENLPDRESVHRISLNKNRLNSISKLLIFSNLVSLNAAENNITEIPKSLCSLSKLQKLRLPYNKIKEVPDSIGECTLLELIHLRGNEISTLPASFFLLRDLEELGLSANKISVIPTAIGKLSKLKRLHLNYNQITAVPLEITELKNLSYLELYDNDLDFFEPSIIEQLPKLKVLDLRKNKLSTNNKSEIKRLFKDADLYD